MLAFDLVAAYVQPAAPFFVNDGTSTADVLTESPQQITLRFGAGVEIDSSTLNAISVIRSGRGGDAFEGGAIPSNFADATVPLGSITVDDIPNRNQVIIRFAESLPDDSYRIVIGNGLSSEPAIPGDPTTVDTASPTSFDFRVELGAHVVSVVPEPVIRGKTIEFLSIPADGDLLAVSVRGKQMVIEFDTNNILSDSNHTRVNVQGMAGVNAVATAVRDALFPGGVSASVFGNPSEMANVVSNNATVTLTGTSFTPVVTATRGGSALATNVVTVADAAVVHHRNRIVVYFNAEDPLDKARAENAAQYRLFDTANNALVGVPNSVDYDAGSGTAVLSFAAGVLAGGTYRLSIGQGENLTNTVASAVNIGSIFATQPFTTSAYLGEGAIRGAATDDVDVYQFHLVAPGNITVTATPSAGVTTTLRLFDDQGAAINAPNLGTVTPTALAAGTYFVGVSAQGNAVYVVTDGTGAQPAGASGPYSLSIATDVAVPKTLANAVSDNNSSFDTAGDFGTLGVGGIVFDSQIDVRQSVTTPIGLPGADDLLFPSQFGSLNQPGHRETPHDSGSHIIETTTLGQAVAIPVIYYNFRFDIGEIEGQPAYNQITEEQKIRTREVFELFSTYVGARFVETENWGFTVATGDLRALDPATPPDGPIGLAGGTMAVMNSWYFTTAAQNVYGEGWFETAMHEIGHLLGLPHSYDIPSIMGSGLSGEPVFPGDYDIEHLRQLFPQTGSDIDVYSFQFDVDGRFSAETIAARPGATITSHVDTVLTLYREDNTGTRTIVARNDDYFGRDSFLSLDLQASDDGGNRFTYYVAVTSTGNTAFDPSVENSGYGGSTDGAYRLSLSFSPQDTAASTIADPTDTPGVFTPLDGDRDGVAGGAYDFWFTTAAADSTIYVDKATAALTTTGTFAVASSVVNVASKANLDIGMKVAGVGIPAGTRIQSINLNANQITLTHNTTLAGTNATLTFGGTEARPFNTISSAIAAAAPGAVVRILGNTGNAASADDEIPYLLGRNPVGNAALADGVTLTVPGGVTVMIDESAVFKLRTSIIDVGSASQNAPRANAALQVLGTPGRNVVFTSFHDDTIGGNSDLITQAPTGGHWGGIVFREDSDSATAGVFVNSVTHASLRYGGGSVTVSGRSQQVYAPIHLETTRPTIAFNTITNTAGAAISANPNSFEESDSRFGPAFRGNLFTETRGGVVHENSVNGVLLRISTGFGSSVEKLTVPARLKSTDLVYVLSENLIIDGGVGGYLHVPVSTLTADLTLGSADVTVPNAGVFSRGMYVVGEGIAEGTQVDSINVGTNVVTLTQPASENGSGVTLTFYAEQARPSGRLAIDPGVVVKLQQSRIELDRGISRLYAEGEAGKRVVFTSIADARFGAGGTFDTNGPGLANVPRPGDWAGIILNAAAGASIDNAYVGFGGGASPIEGITDDFNVIEVHQGQFRIANSRIENNSDGDSLTNRTGRGFNDAATIFVRGAQPVIVGNDFRDNLGATVSINANALSDVTGGDVGRSTGPIGRYSAYDDNFGPLVRDNLLSYDRATVLSLNQVASRPSDTDLTAMRVRPEEITVESVWDDTDIVHVLGGEIIVQNFHTATGVRLMSDPDVSLVVKLIGSTAGFTAAGYGLDIDDRIGGTVQVVGQPGYPVVLTSLRDDTIGASRDPLNRLVKDTNSDGGLTAPSPADWRSLRFLPFSNDRNVRIYPEAEPGLTDGIEENNNTGSAELLGVLGPNHVVSSLENPLVNNTWESVQEKGGDENRRLGFEIHGVISPDDPTDVDLYQFTGYAGSEVWIDVDKTSPGLDAMVELLDANGTVLARSTDSQHLTKVTDSTLLGAGVAGQPTRRAFQLASGVIAGTVSGTVYVGTVATQTFTVNAAGVATFTNVEGVPSNPATLVSLTTATGLLTLNFVADPGAAETKVIVTYDHSPLSPATIGAALPLEKDAWRGTDFYSVNPRDPGMRVILPGTIGATDEYWIRVRSQPKQSDNNGVQLSSAAYETLLQSTTFDQPEDPAAGATSGRYELRVRLRQRDEKPGSTVQTADIRYPTIGIDVIGLPRNSMLLGEAGESTGDNDARTSAQFLGNLLTTDRNTVSVAGELTSESDVDWYSFILNYEQIQTGGGIDTWSTVFDIDYGDNFKGDYTLTVYDSQFRLLYVGRDSNVADDQPGMNQGADADDLSRGSFGTRDPFIGPVQMPVGPASGVEMMRSLDDGDTQVPASTSSYRYYVAVWSNERLPAVLDATFESSATNALVRLEPVNSITRVVEDHIGFVGYSDSYGNRIEPTTPAIIDVTSAERLSQNVREFTLADVTLFLTTGDQLRTYDADTGVYENLIADFADNYRIADLDMRPDGRLYLYRGLENDTGNAGQLVEVDPGTGSVLATSNDGLENVNNTDNNTFKNWQVNSDNVLATAFRRTGVGDYDELWLVVNSGTGKSRIYRAADGGTASGGASATGDISWNSTGLGYRGDVKVAGVDAQITGLQFVQDTGTMYAVDTVGRLLMPQNLPRVQGPTTPNNWPDLPTYDADFSVVADYSSDLLTIGATGFTALAAAPQNLYGGAFRGKFFALTNAGGLVVIDPATRPAVTTTGTTDGSTTVSGLDLGDDQNIATGMVVFGGATVPYNTTVSGANTVDGSVTLSQAAANSGAIGMQFVRPAATVSGTLTMNSHTVTFVTPAAIDAVQPGMVVIGANIPENTTVVAKTDASITLTQAATASGSQSLKFLAVNVSRAGGTTNSSTTVSNLSTVNDLRVGMLVFGQGIARGTTITGVNRGNRQITLSQNATGTVAVNNLSFVSTSSFEYLTDWARATPLGNVIANDTTGVTSPELVPGATGIAFSPLDVNLWHPTLYRSNEAGHGINPTTGTGDNTRDGSDLQRGLVLPRLDDDGGISNNTGSIPERNGGASMYFGLEQHSSTPAPGSTNTYYVDSGQSGQFGVLLGGSYNWQQELTANPNIGNNYNLPGGAYGSLITNAFSLATSTYADKPTLYFNYWLDTEDAAGGSGSNAMRDSARVFYSIDDGQTWQVIATNNSTRSSLDSTDAELPNTLSASSAIGQLHTQIVQELYDASEWRQARIDLGNLAGEANIRLRFDFSTAGEFDRFQVDANGDLINNITTPLGGTAVANTTGDFTSTSGNNGRGANNQHGGFFVDDIIVGFAERGEMVTGTTGSTAETTPYDLDTPVSTSYRPQQLSGTYQLEIRRGTEYGTQPNDAGQQVTIAQTFDTNSQFVPFPSAPAATLRSDGFEATPATAVFEVFDPFAVNLAIAARVAAPTVTEFFTPVPTFEGSQVAQLSTVFANDRTRATWDVDLFENRTATVRTTNGSTAAVVNSADIGGIRAGMVVSGPGIIVDGTTITSVVGTNITLSLPAIATATAPAALLTFHDIRPTAYLQFAYFREQRPLEWLPATFVATLVDDAPAGAGVAISVDGGTNWTTIFDFTRQNEGWRTVGIDLAGAIDAAGFAASSLVTAGSALVALPSTAGLLPGMRVTSGGGFTGIPANTFIQSINSATEITLSQAATVSQAGVSFTFDLLDPAAGGATVTSVTLPGTVRIGFFHAGSNQMTFLDDLALYANVPVVHSGLIGDQNLPREQGQFIIVNNIVRQASLFGISVDAGLRDQSSNIPHPGVPRNLRYVNEGRFAPGVVITSNVIADTGTTSVAGTAIRFSGDTSTTMPAAVPYGRIINNTIYGGATRRGTGIAMSDNVAPTLINNVFANLTTGIQVDATSVTDPTSGDARTVVSHSAFHNVLTLISAGVGLSVSTTLNLGSNPADSPFVDPSRYNFYPKAVPANTPTIIDSSLSVYQDRQAYQDIVSPLGIPASPLIVPERDLYGQLREADSTVGGGGLGQNTVFDRGAIDRVDDDRPTMYFVTPVDGAAGDVNSAANVVRLERADATGRTQFVLQLTDVGIGIDDLSVTTGAFALLFRPTGPLNNWATDWATDAEVVKLIDGEDYIFTYLDSTKTALFEAPSVWPLGEYLIVVNNMTGQATTAAEVAARINTIDENDATITLEDGFGGAFAATAVALTVNGVVQQNVLATVTLAGVLAVTDNGVNGAANTVLQNLEEGDVLGFALPAAVGANPPIEILADTIRVSSLTPAARAFAVSSLVTVDGVQRTVDEILPGGAIKLSAAVDVARNDSVSLSFSAEPLRDMAANLLQNNDVAGVGSTAFGVALLAAPGVVTDIAVVEPVGVDQVTLEFTPPVIAQRGGREIENYIIEQSLDGVTWTPFNDGVSATPQITVTGLQNGTSYRFRIAAHNGIDQGPWAVFGPVAPMRVPTVTLVTDGGNDGITNDGAVTVGLIEPNATWEYSVDSGVSWVPSDGSTEFMLGEAVYAANDVQVRQVMHGFVSGVGTFLDATPAARGVEIDTTRPAAPTFALATDSGRDQTDGVTNPAAVNVTGLEPGAAWEYTTDSGINWTAGAGASFNIPLDGYYPAGTIRVRQTDVAGNRSVDSSGVDWDAGGRDLIGTFAAETLMGTADGDLLVGNGGLDTLIGNAGADYLRGSTNSDLVEAAQRSTDADTLFAGAVSTLDANSGIYAESQEPAIVPNSIAAWNSLRGTNVSWADHHDDALVGANILEGRGGDDIAVASSQRDIFLYRSLANADLAGANGGAGMTAQQFLGTDVIHNFRIGVDAIAVVITIAGDDFTFYGGNQPADDPGNDQFSLLASGNGWTWTRTGADSGTLSFASAAVGNVNPGGTGSEGNFSIEFVGLQGAVPESTNAVVNPDPTAADAFFLGRVVGGTANNDYLLGDAAIDTFVGGDGADYLRGEDQGATDEALNNASDVDVLFAGRLSNPDPMNGVYGESQQLPITSSVVNADFSAIYAPWTTHHADVLRASNILEGRGGNDIAVASSQRDVVLYKTFSNQMLGGQGITAASFLGTDVIHNFRIGTDSIAVVVDLGGADYTFYGGAMPQDGASQFSLLASGNGWTWTKTSATSGTLSFDSSGMANALNAGGDGAEGDFSINFVGLQGIVPDSTAAVTNPTAADAFFLNGNVKTTLLVGDPTGQQLLGTAAAETIIGLAGDDDLIGNGGPDLLSGGDGVDFVRGATHGATLEATTRSTDADVLFGGDFSVFDPLTGVYAESRQADIPVNAWNAAFALEYAPWAGHHQRLLQGADILEARGGDDTVVASNQRDVVLYKSFANADLAAAGITAQQFLGTDVVHNFRIGVDSIAVVMAIGGGDYTFLGSGAAVSLFTAGAQTGLLASGNGWTWIKTSATSGTLSFDSSGMANALNAGGIGNEGDFSITFVGLQGVVPDSTATVTNPTAADAFFLGNRTIVLDTVSPAAPVVTWPAAGAFTNVQPNVGGLEPGAGWRFSTDGGNTWTVGVGSSLALPNANYPANSMQVQQLDLAGNPSTSVLNPEFAIDTVAPQVTIGIEAGSLTALKAGETTQIEFVLTESAAPGSFDATDVSVSNGILGPIVADNTYVGVGERYTAEFTPAAGFTGTATVSVMAGMFTDLAGNANLASNAINIAIDTIVPTLAIARVPAAVTPLGIGDVATIEFLLSEAAVVTAPGSFVATDITVTGGTIGPLVRDLNFTGPGLRYTTVFTPFDNSAVAASISVAGNVFTDLAGNGNAPSNVLAVAVDTIAPTVIVTSAAAALKIGETTQVTFTLSEDAATSPNDFVVGDVTLTGGVLSSPLARNGNIYTATFTPAAGFEGNASISVAAGVFLDAADNANVASNTLTLSVDTIAPTVVITSSAASVKIGETTTITFTLSEATAVAAPGSFVAGDVTVSNGSGTLGAVTLDNAYGGPGVRYTAVFTPAADFEGTASISVAAGGFTDLAGNGNVVSSTLTLAIDTIAPTVALVSTASALKVGETATITFTLSETAAAAPGDFGVGDVTVTNGVMSSLAKVGNVYTGTFTPASNFEGTATISVAAGVFTDVVGNANAPSTTALQISVDTKRPTVLIASSAASLKRGETASITFTLSEATAASPADFTAGDVTVTGGVLTSPLTRIGNVYTGTFTPTTNFEGIATLRVNAARFTDLVGNDNAAGVPISITVDTLPPTTAIFDAIDDVSPIKGLIGAGGVTNDPQPEIYGTTSEPISQVEIFQGATSLGIATINNPTSTGWIFEIPAGVMSQDGVYSFTARGTDLAGNVGVESAAFSVVLDTSANAPAVTGPVASGSSSTQRIIDLQVTTDERASQIEIFSGNTRLGFATLAADGRSATFRTGTLAYGTHVFKARMTDMVGNTAMSAAYQITIQQTITDPPPPPPPPTSPPSIVRMIDDMGPVTGDVGSGGTTDDTTLQIIGTAAAGETVTVVAVSGGQSVPVGTAIADENGSWSLNVDPPLADGTYAFRATGIAGASVDYTVTIQQPTNPPSPTTPITAGAVWGPATPAGFQTIALSFTEPVAGVTLDVITLTHRGRSISLRGASLSPATGARYVLTLPSRFLDPLEGYRIMLAYEQIRSISDPERRLDQNSSVIIVGQPPDPGLSQA